MRKRRMRSRKYLSRKLKRKKNHRRRRRGRRWWRIQWRIQWRMMLLRRNIMTREGRKTMMSMSSQRLMTMKSHVNSMTKMTPGRLRLIARARQPLSKKSSWIQLGSIKKPISLF